MTPEERAALLEKFKQDEVAAKRRRAIAHAKRAESVYKAKVRITIPHHGRRHHRRRMWRAPDAHIAIIGEGCGVLDARVGGAGVPTRWSRRHEPRAASQERVCSVRVRACGRPRIG